MSTSIAMPGLIAAAATELAKLDSELGVANTAPVAWDFRRTPQPRGDVARGVGYDRRSRVGVTESGPSVPSTTR